MVKSLNEKGFFLVSVVMLILELGIPSYFQYAILFLWGIYNTGSIKYKESFITALLLVGCTQLIRIWQLNTRVVLDAGLILITVYSWLNGKYVPENKVGYLNFIAAIVFFISQSTGLSSITLSDLESNFIDSSSALESKILSFLFPMFAIYYCQKKKYKWTFANVCLTLIAGKRIAFLGLMLGLCCTIFVKNNFRSNLLNKKWIFSLFGLIVNSSFLLLTVMFANGNFSDLIMEYTGLSANHFTQGRERIYAMALAQFNFYNCSDIFLGVGNIRSVIHELLHNDVLKIFLENGIIIFFLFWILYYRKANALTLPYLLYFNVLFLTDNVSIYPVILFYMFMFLRISTKKSIENKNLSPKSCIQSK